MVVFTCHHCGDSIQKPKVEKHIKLECRKKYLSPRLCCVDCLKDFDFKSYVEHTKCVTEEERYSGKGFVPKPSSNKGEKKQSTWTEVMRTVLKKSNLDDLQRALLKALSNYPNVPRKQQKFKNFISSSLKHLRASNTTMDQVFKLIEDEFKASNVVNSMNNQVQKKDSVNSQQPDEPKKVEKSEEVQLNDESTNMKKKNKSKLKDIENTDIREEPTSSAEKDNLNESASFEVVKKKKKKSKKENVENEIIAMEVDKPDNSTQSDDKTSVKPLESNMNEDVSLKGISKKLKKSKLKEVPENLLTDESQTTTQNCDTEIVPNDVSTMESNLNEEVSMKGISKKKLKKLKLLKEVHENPPCDDSQTITQNSATEIVSNDVSTTESNLNEDVSMKGVSKKKLKKLKLLQEVHENPPCDDSQTNITQNGSIEVDSNEVSTILVSPEKIKAIDEVKPVEENLSKKERKERKKRLKYEAELKAVETEVIEGDELNGNLGNETDKNQKQKKKKRKLSESIENEKDARKKIKKTESVASNAEEENSEPIASKFKWETVIRAVLEKAEGNEISLKKLTKKVVAEYQACHGEDTPYDDVLRKFNKKVTKCPFVKILKDKVKLSV